VLRREQLKARTISPLSLLLLAGKTLDHSWRTYRGHRSLSEGAVLRRLTPRLERPIFLVGAPRSGTTFFGSCLASLPELSYHHEPVATKAAARYIYEQLWTEQQATRFYRRVYRWLMLVHLDGDLRFAEKTPRNCMILEFLDRAFPTAQFIHVIRDGRDAALSGTREPWLLARNADSGKYEPGGYPVGPYAQFWVEEHRREQFESTTDLHRCIWQWRRMTEHARQFGQRMPSTKFLEIRYESLVRQPTAVAERVLSFLNMERAVSTERFLHAVGRVRADSVGRWKNELSTDQLATIDTEAGALLRILGYS